MKKILILFVLLFSSSVFADDIFDFQIEGMSVGDSLLDYADKKEIEERKKYYPNSKKWARYSNLFQSSNVYGGFQVHFKTDDNNYIIQSLDGLKLYENNIEECYKKMDEIEKQFSELFKNTRKEKGEKEKHAWDKSGKSTIKRIIYWFDSGDAAVIACTDWSKETGLTDKLKVSIETKQYVDWISTEAY